MAGFGAEYQQNHVLGRGQVQVPASLRSLVLPQLVGLVVELLATPTHATLLPVLQALHYLTEVWLQVRGCARGSRVTLTDSDSVSF